MIRMLIAIFAVSVPNGGIQAGPSRLVREDKPLLKLHAVPFTQVTIDDAFWAPRRETNRRVSIPHSLKMLEESGNVTDLQLAIKGARAGYRGPVFMDSDLYKAIEAASYSLATHPDAGLEKKIDAIISLMAAAQRPDGYLNTYYEVNEPDRRWTNLRDNHELYCAGHLFEAAVAHYQATGKKSLLDIATKYADYIDSVFGAAPGKRMGYPGHPEIELALVKLWRVTGQARYLELARFFVDNRGSKFFAKEHGEDPAHYDGTYWQDNVPIREHRRIVGHAVRAAYLMSGVVDVAAQTNDEGLLKMVDRVWRNTTLKNTYITGGIGPSASNEGFTSDYDLPNLTAYQETCASVAMAMWNQRLALLYGNAKYADRVERALYNGILSGVSLDGTKFFYVNPLTSAGNHHRSGWFGCACCPPNVTRTLAQLGGYAYGQSDSDLYVNLFIAGSVQVKLGETPVSLDVKTRYPWEGIVKLSPTVPSPTRFALHLRVPGWCRSFSVSVNGERLPLIADERGYVVVDRTWKTGDQVTYDMPMTVERLAANPNVKQDAGKLAIQRGPIVYCLEGVDQKAPVHEIAIRRDSELKPEWRSDLLGGVMVLHGTAEVADQPDWTGRLYAPVDPLRKVEVTAVPYYAWDNRAPGEMSVWIPVTPPAPHAGGIESTAKVTMSFVSGNCQPEGVNDGIEPKSSDEQPAQLCHWWPHKGGEEWVQYTWKSPVRVAGARIYWFDDTGRGACRLPVSAQVLYRSGNEWKPVQAESPVPVAKDRWCELHFAPVEAKELRLVVQMQPEWAAGVRQWRLISEDD